MEINISNLGHHIEIGTLTKDTIIEARDRRSPFEHCEKEGGIGRFFIPPQNARLGGHMR